MTFSFFTLGRSANFAGKKSAVTHAGNIDTHPLIIAQPDDTPRQKYKRQGGRNYRPRNFSCWGETTGISYCNSLTWPSEWPDGIRAITK